MAFQQAGTEGMRLTSTGLGIGTSSPSSYATDARNLVIASSGNTGMTIRSGTTSTGVISFANAENSTSNNGIVSFNHNDLSLNFNIYGTGRSYRFQSAGTEVMRLDSSGNLGIGTTSITSGAGWTSRLVLADATAPALIVRGPNSQEGSVGVNNGVFIDSLGNTTGTNNNIIFRNTSTNSSFTANERARIDTSGNLLVGTTSSIGNNGVLQVKRTNAGACLYLETDSSSGTQNVVDIVNAANAAIGQMIRFWVNGYGVTQVGSISTTTSSTAYNTSSDYRLKNTVIPMTGALAKVALLKPVTYKWNNDGSYGEGFIAHELAEVVPDCVTGEKDAVDENGKIKPQGIDTSFLVATLTAAIQEQQTLITQLTARITALEGA
jgi:hypothetical protein